MTRTSLRSTRIPQDNLNRVRQQKTVGDLFAPHLQTGTLTGSTCTWTEQHAGPRGGTYTTTVTVSGDPPAQSVRIETLPGDTVPTGRRPATRTACLIRAVDAFTLPSVQAERRVQYHLQGQDGTPGQPNTFPTGAAQVVLQLVLERLQADLQAPPEQAPEQQGPPPFTLNVDVTHRGRLPNWSQPTRVTFRAGPAQHHIDVRESKYDPPSNRWLLVKEWTLPLTLLPDALAACCPPHTPPPELHAAYDDTLSLLRDLKTRSRPDRVSAELFLKDRSVLTLGSDGALDHRPATGNDLWTLRDLQERTSLHNDRPGPAEIVEQGRTGELRGAHHLPVDVHPDLALLLLTFVTHTGSGAECVLHWTQEGNRPRLNLWFRRIDARHLSCRLHEEDCDTRTHVLEVTQIVPVLTRLNRRYLQDTLAR